MVAELATIGIVPGKAFDPSNLYAAVSKGLARAPKAGQEKIESWFKGSVAGGDAKFIDGWRFTTKTGTYGTNYLQRALIAAFGLGANLPQDAVYPTSEVDADGKPYSGANKYVLHFDKSEMPPVDGFWSLTMYDGEFFFVENPLKRHALSQRNRFMTNADGSIDLYIQSESPGKRKSANWLPAPKGTFILMLRLYWPRETPPSILDGSWTIPGVRQAG